MPDASDAGDEPVRIIIDQDLSSQPLAQVQPWKLSYDSELHCKSLGGIGLGARLSPHHWDSSLAFPPLVSLHDPLPQTNQQLWDSSYLKT